MKFSKVSLKNCGFGGPIVPFFGTPCRIHNININNNQENLTLNTVFPVLWFCQISDLNDKAWFILTSYTSKPSCRRNGGTNQGFSINVTKILTVKESDNWISSLKLLLQNTFSSEFQENSQAEICLFYSYTTLIYLLDKWACEARVVGGVRSPDPLLAKL